MLVISGSKRAYEVEDGDKLFVAGSDFGHPGVNCCLHVIHKTGLLYVTLTGAIFTTEGKKIWNGSLGSTGAHKYIMYKESDE